MDTAVDGAQRDDSVVQRQECRSVTGGRRSGLIQPDPLGALRSEGFFIQHRVDIMKIVEECLDENFLHWCCLRACGLLGRSRG